MGKILHLRYMLQEVNLFQVQKAFTNYEDKLKTWTWGLQIRNKMADKREIFNICHNSIKDI